MQLGDSCLSYQFWFDASEGPIYYRYRYTDTKMAFSLNGERIKLRSFH